MAGLVLGGAYGDIADGIGIAGYGLDALSVAVDDGLGFTSEFFRSKCSRKSSRVERPSALFTKVMGASLPPACFQAVVLPV